MTTPSSIPYHAATVAWFDARGMLPPPGEHPDWYVYLHLSTVPPWDWSVRASKVAAHELWFGYSVGRLFGWRALLHRRDDALQVTWSNGLPLHVDRGTFLQRHRTPWPSMSGPEDLVATIGHLENLLQVRFHRHIEVGAPTLKPCDFEALRQWLRPICDTFTCTIGRLNGAIPPGLRCDDRGREDAGLSCKVDAATPIRV